MKFKEYIKEYYKNDWNRWDRNRQAEKSSHRWDSALDKEEKEYKKYLAAKKNRPETEEEKKAREEREEQTRKRKEAEFNRDHEEKEEENSLGEEEKKEIERKLYALKTKLPELQRRLKREHDVYYGQDGRIDALQKRISNYKNWIVYYDKLVKGEKARKPKEGAPRPHEER